MNSRLAASVWHSRMWCSAVAMMIVAWPAPAGAHQPTGSSEPTEAVPTSSERTRFRQFCFETGLDPLTLAAAGLDQTASASVYTRAADLFETYDPVLMSLTAASIDAQATPAEQLLAWEQRALQLNSARTAVLDASSDLVKSDVAQLVGNRLRPVPMEFRILDLNGTEWRDLAGQTRLAKMSNEPPASLTAVPGSLLATVNTDPAVIRIRENITANSTFATAAFDSVATTRFED